MRSLKLVAADDERDAIEAVRQLLKGGDAALVRVDGARVVLPASLRDGLSRLADGLVESGAVALNPVDRELTTQEAADLLNVSRPYLVKLLDEGVIPSRLVGTHRRVPLQPVLDFKRRRSTERRDLFREMARLSQDLGLV